MPEGTHARAVRHAAHLVGGIRILAAQLAVLPGAVQAWIDSNGIPPERVFLQVVDILLAHDGRPR